MSYSSQKQLPGAAWSLRTELRRVRDDYCLQVFTTVFGANLHQGKCIWMWCAADCMPSFKPIMVEGYAALFSCTAVVQASDSMTASM